MYYQRTFHAQKFEDFHEKSSQAISVNTTNHGIWLGRVRQRSQDVEDRSDAQLQANRAHVFHGRMIGPGKQESEAAGREHGGHL